MQRDAGCFINGARYFTSFPVETMRRNARSRSYVVPLESAQSTQRWYSEVRVFMPLIKQLALLLGGQPIGFRERFNLAALASITIALVLDLLIFSVGAFVAIAAGKS